MKMTKNLTQKRWKEQIIFFIFLMVAQVANAQTQTDFNQSGLQNFKTKVIPILNGIVAVFAILGIFYAAYKFLTGDADGGKRFFISVIIGGVIWFVAAQIVSAL